MFVRLGFVMPLIFLMHASSVFTAFSQLQEGGTGVVNGYLIGPGVDLRSADLRRADLEGANLENADLRDADLEGANLSMASLIGCNLDGVNLSGAILHGVIISDSNVAPAISGAGRATYLKVIALEEIGAEHESKIGLLLDAGDNREMRLGNLEEGRQDQDMEITSIKDVMNAMNVKLEQLSAQIPVLQAAIVERDEKIAILQKRPTIDQLMEGRAAAFLYKIDEGKEGKVTLSLRIEQSEDLSHWTPVDEVITRTFPIPEGKRFYRFALAQ